jgi:hypothetical protein
VFAVPPLTIEKLPKLTPEPESSLPHSRAVPPEFIFKICPLVPKLEGVSLKSIIAGDANSTAVAPVFIRSTCFEVPRLEGVSANVVLTMLIGTVSETVLMDVSMVSIAEFNVFPQVFSLAPTSGFGIE